MNPEIAERLNNQISLEFNTAFLFLSLSVQLKDYGMRGAGGWMRSRYHDTCEHTLHILGYLELCRIPVAMPTISPVEYSWDSPPDLFRLAREHASLISDAIHHLISLCRREADHATEQFLMPRIRSQVLLESRLSDILRDLLRCGRDASALLYFDHTLR